MPLNRSSGFYPSPQGLGKIPLHSPILYGGFIMAKGRSGGGKGPGKGAMTGKAAARVQAAEAKANGGQNPKGGFAARAQRAAAKNSG